MAIKKRTFLNSQHEAVPEGGKMKKPVYIDKHVILIGSPF